MGEDCGEVGGKDGDNCVNDAHSPTILTNAKSYQSLLTDTNLY